MRGTGRALCALLGIVAIVAVSEAAVAAAAVAPPLPAAITAVAPAPGQTVGVAHPVVVEFATPVADRITAQRALHLRSVPPMQGHFHWVDAHTVHWTPSGSGRPTAPSHCRWADGRPVSRPARRCWPWPMSARTRSP